MIGTKRKRYRVLYTPSGRAGEYADHGYAVNLYRGCAHGCLYCYVPNPRFGLSREDFHREVHAAPMVLERLAADLRQCGVLPEPVFLCFTCDPYPPGDDLNALTRKAIEIINRSGNAVNILTKGGMRASRDFDLLIKNPKNRIGATLTFQDADKAREWEPGAADPDERISMLAAAKLCGISTWASMEPVIEPDESLAMIRLAHKYVDEFKIGKWNHDPRASRVNWKHFREEAAILCKGLGVRCTIKKDLKSAI